MHRSPVSPERKRSPLSRIVSAVFALASVKLSNGTRRAREVSEHLRREASLEGVRIGRFFPHSSEREAARRVRQGEASTGGPYHLRAGEPVGSRGCGCSECVRLRREELGDHG